MQFLLLCMCTMYNSELNKSIINTINNSDKHTKYASATEFIVHVYNSEFIILLTQLLYEADYLGIIARLKRILKQAVKKVCR